MIELVHLKAKVSKLESQLAAADASSKHTKIEHDSQILSLEQQLQVQRLYYSQLLLNACGVTTQSNLQQLNSESKSVVNITHLVLCLKLTLNERLTMFPGF